MNTEWKDIYFEENGIIYDYKGLYQVSNDGRIKSLKDNRGNKREKILKYEKKNDGYLRINLYKNKNVKHFYIHRLVAHMFLSNFYFEGAEVNHKDENKENNCIDNLEWCTTSININHGTRNEKSGKKGGKTRSKKVIGYSLTETKVIILQSAKQGKNLGFDPGHISDCCIGKRKTHKGYKWKHL